MTAGVTAYPLGTGALDLAGGRGVWPQLGGEVAWAAASRRRPAAALTFPSSVVRCASSPWSVAGGPRRPARRHRHLGAGRRLAPGSPGEPAAGALLTMASAGAAGDRAARAGRARPRLRPGAEPAGPGRPAAAPVGGRHGRPRPSAAPRAPRAAPAAGRCSPGTSSRWCCCPCSWPDWCSRCCGSGWTRSTRRYAARWSSWSWWPSSVRCSSPRPGSSAGPPTRRSGRWWPAASSPCSWSRSPSPCAAP